MASENTPLITRQSLRSSMSRSRPKLLHSASSTSVNSTSFTYDSFKFTKKAPKKLSYFQYYLPILSWLPNYSFDNLGGDIIAGFSLASFLIPLVMSFSRLANIDLKCGLMGIIVGPIVYSIFGSCTFLITGPEAAISLILGNLMESLLHNAKNLSALQILQTTTLLSGLILFIAGLFRLGFVGNVVSKGLLNGFISGLGILMIVTELLTQLGISQYFEQLHQQDPSTIDKLVFIVQNSDLAHSLTCKISAVATVSLLLVRYLKKYLIHCNKDKFYWLNFFPEILFVVVASILACQYNRWDLQGVTVIGKYFNSSMVSGTAVDAGAAIDADASTLQLSFRLVRKCLGTAFICAVLGFFESSTATKALENQHNIDFSLNRELVALGAVNIIGSFFSILPSFGGYGRSKINSLTSKSQLSGVILAVISLAFYTFFLNAFYYLPECILASIITTVAVSLIEESPENLKFYWNIKGYDEIAMFSLIVVSTLFWSPEVGLCLGLGLSVVKVIKFSTQTKIQILGRVPNSSVFRNADELIEETFDGVSDIERADQLEEIDNCLIVKVTEPLMFANSNNLRTRLKRLEKYRSLNVHPSEQSQSNKSKYIIIDCKSMTQIDSSSTLTLCEIVKNYCESGYIVMFTRIPFDIDLRVRFIESGIVRMVKKALEKVGRVRERAEGSSYGLGEGFYTSIEEALRVVDSIEN